MTRSLVLSALVLAALPLAVGCGGSAKATVKADVKVKKKKKVKKVEPAPEPIVQASPTIGVSEDLAEQCTVRINNVSKAPKFDYNDVNLLAEDKDVLDVVASCVTTGPLKGRSIQLVGRADPRGTMEYNLALGTKRATTVARYLEKVGVSSKQIALTTRGDLDADGREEAAWREDRRVDLTLAPE